MARPIVEIIQSVANIQTTVTDPTQSTLIIGPNYDVISYSKTGTSAENALAKSSDDYAPYTGLGHTNSTTEAIPVDRGTSIDTASIELFLEDCRYEVGAVQELSLIHI